MRTLLLVVGILSGCSILEYEPHFDTTVSENLSYLINPVSENEEDYRKAHRVCDCVDEKASAAWMPEKYLAFSKELAEHVEGLLTFFENYEKKKVPVSDYPKTSESLTEYLNSLSNYVVECEKMFETRVEF